MAEVATKRSAKLTKRTVDAAAAEPMEYILWDTEIPGFGLRVGRSGAKSYVFKYRVGGGRGGTKRKPTIGRHGSMTPEQARGIAKDWAAEVRRGGDPSLQRQEARQAVDMNELFDRYLAEHADLHKKASSVSADRRMIEKRLRKAIGRKKIEQVTRSDIAAVHRALAPLPYEANRTLALLSKCFSLAERWGLRPDGSNPCRHVARYKESKRERFLSQKELARLGQALAAAERGELTGEDGEPLALSPYAVAAIRLLIFTGARKSEVLQLRWDHVNLEAGRLELPDSKTGAKFVYLPAPARKMLADLPCVSGNSYVIVGGKPGAHLVNIQDPWVWIRAAAGLPNVRLHDLRHSFASVGAGGGMSLPIIGALLGHRETATTARYAHLSDDLLRVASDEIGRRIEEAMAEAQKAYSATFGERHGGFAYGRIEYDDGLVRRGVDVVLGPDEPLPKTQDELAAMFGQGEPQVLSGTRSDAIKELRDQHLTPLRARREVEGGIDRIISRFAPETPGFSAATVLALEGEIDRLHDQAENADRTEDREAAIIAQRQLRERMNRELERLALKSKVEPRAKARVNQTTGWKAKVEASNAERRDGRLERRTVAEEIATQIVNDGQKGRSQRQLARDIKKRAKKLASNEQDLARKSRLEQLAECSTETIRRMLRGAAPSLEE